MLYFVIVGAQRELDQLYEHAVARRCARGGQYVNVEPRVRAVVPRSVVNDGVIQLEIVRINRLFINIIEYVAFCGFLRCEPDALFLESDTAAFVHGNETVVRVEVRLRG